MKKIVILLLTVICTTNVASAWSKSGHYAIAYIAECNLTKRAKENVEKYLGGKSIVYFASWMDEYRRTPEYGNTTDWHMAAVDKDFNCTDAMPNAKKRNAALEVENAMKLLKDYKNLDDSTVAVNIKYIVHLVGDMHCPVHIYYPGLKISFDITLNGVKDSYHHIWDGTINETCHRWSYTEWQQQLDRYSPKDKEAITAGTPRDWCHDNAVFCRKIYDMVVPDGEYGIDFLNAAHPIAERQIIYAGYRLAKVLNEIFG